MLKLELSRNSFIFPFFRLPLHIPARTALAWFFLEFDFPTRLGVSKLEIVAFVVLCVVLWRFHSLFLPANESLCSRPPRGLGLRLRVALGRGLA